MAARIRRLFLLGARLEVEPAALEDLTAGPPGQAIWELAAAIARRVNQEPLFHAFWSRHAPHAPLLAETKRDLEAQTRLHAFRWAEIREVSEEVLAALARAGIRPILLKGISLVGECFDPPHLRPMRDIDLLLRAEEIQRGREVLERSGFRSDPGAHPAERYAGHHHLPPLFHPMTGTCLELHHHLMRLPAYFGGFPPIEAFWKTARESSLFAGKALVLDRTLQVLAISIHITHGDTIGRRAQNLIDLSRTMELHAQDIDWDQIVAHAASVDMARSLALPLAYLSRESLVSAPAETLSRLLSLSRFRRWEEKLLSALISRYRIGSPPPWRLVSGRMSNILWRQSMRSGWLFPRALSALRDVLVSERLFLERKPAEGGSATSSPSKKESACPSASCPGPP